MGNVTNVYIGNEHSYTIKRVNAQCFEVYIHNRFVENENLIDTANSYKEAMEIIDKRLKMNSADSYAVRASKMKVKGRRKK